MAVLAAGVQQGLVRVDDLRLVANRTETLHRHKLIIEVLGDIAGGSQAISELDFMRLVVRAFGLPEPSRQEARRDQRGRRRWIDAAWDDCKVAVEIDGAPTRRTRSSAGMTWSATSTSCSTATEPCASPPG
jgi:hypothetical protein